MYMQLRNTKQNIQAATLNHRAVKCLSSLKVKNKIILFVTYNFRNQLNTCGFADSSSSPVHNLSNMKIENGRILESRDAGLSFQQVYRQWRLKLISILMKNTASIMAYVATNMYTQAWKKSDNSLLTLLQISYKNVICTSRVVTTSSNQCDT